MTSPNLHNDTSTPSSLASASVSESGDSDLGSKECPHEIAARHQARNPACPCRACYYARPRPLPLTPNVDGRPVWEPPAFNYNAWIGDEYYKKRKAVMKYTNDDRAATTRFLDFDTELGLSWMYVDWTWENSGEEETKVGESGKNDFFDGLRRELLIDHWALVEEFGKIGFWLERDGDGEYEVVGAEETEASGSVSVSGGESEESGEMEEDGENSSAVSEVEESASSNLAEESDDERQSDSETDVHPRSTMDATTQTAAEDQSPDEGDDSYVAPPNDLLSLWW